jgi:hypothetical protein
MEEGRELLADFFFTGEGCDGIATNGTGEDAGVALV